MRFICDKGLKKRHEPISESFFFFQYAVTIYEGVKLNILTRHNKKKVKVNKRKKIEKILKKNLLKKYEKYSHNF